MTDGGEAGGGSIDLKKVLILPPPFPPVVDWVENNVLRASDFDPKTLFEELKIIAVFIYREKMSRKAPTKLQDNLTKLRKIREALRIIEKELPELIDAAEIQLTLDIKNQSVIDRFPALFNSREEMKNDLLLEKNLLDLTIKIRNGGGFFGVLPHKISEPWVGEAGLLFEFWIKAFEKSGLSTPGRASVSERTPIIRIIRDSLEWIGYGNLELARIAQNLKRSAKLTETGAKRTDFEYIAKRVWAQAVVLGQLAPDVCPDDMF